MLPLLLQSEGRQFFKGSKGFASNNKANVDRFGWKTRIPHVIQCFPHLFLFFIGENAAPLSSKLS